MRLPQGSGCASVVRGISQSWAGETFVYAAQGRSQRLQTCRVDAPWYGTRAMQVTTPRGQNCARRAQFCVSALCPLATTPFDEISRNLKQGYSATRAFKICISKGAQKIRGVKISNFQKMSFSTFLEDFGRIMKKEKNPNNFKYPKFWPPNFSNP